MASFPARLNLKRVCESGVPESRPGRILAIDYGRKRIGLAVSDELRTIARPLETVVRTNRRNDVHRLKQACEKLEIALIVVGLPLHISGEQSKMAQEASRFAGRLEKELGVQVVMLDERLTTWEAKHTLAEAGRASKRKQKDLDSLAAAVLLRDYLSLKRGEALAPSAAKE